MRWGEVSCEGAEEGGQLFSISENKYALEKELTATMIIFFIF